MNARVNSESWWLHPLAAVSLATVPFIVTAHLLSDSSYLELWKAQKHLNGASFVMTAATLVTFAFGYALSWWMRRNQPNEQPPTPTINTKHLSRLFVLAAALTISGYLVWAIILLRSVGLETLLASFRVNSGASYAIRDAGTTIPGITTMTQFGIAAVILGALLLKRGYHRRPVQVILCVLILLSILRAFIWSERLAVIELVVPLAIVTLIHPRQKSHPHFRTVCYLAPLIGGTGLYLYFTSFEFFRSWSTTNATGDVNIWAFAWTRLAGYYITALNNGMLTYSELGRLPIPYYALEWFWKLPGLATLLPYDQITGVAPRAQGDILKAMANPEFTNPSGIFPYFLDFGPVAYLFWVLCGVFSGFAYHAFRAERLAGLLFYPFLFVGLIELGRVPYLSSGRAFPAWVFLVMSFLLLKSRDESAARTRVSSPHYSYEERRGLS